MQDNQTLLPCPNPACDEKEALLYITDDSKVGYYAHCRNCGMKGPSWEDKQTVIDLWNALPRHSAPSAESVTLRAQLATQIAVAEIQRTDNQFGNGYVRFTASGIGRDEVNFAVDAKHCVSVADAILAAVNNKEQAA